MSRINPEPVFKLSDCGAPGSLIFSPDVGGNVLYARPLVAELSKDVSCSGLRLSPDLTERLPELGVPDISARFAEEIVRRDSPGPVFLAGHSFAAYFAVETARQMASLGAPPDGVFILDMPVRSSLPLIARLRSPRRTARQILSRTCLRLRTLLRPGAEIPVLARRGFMRIDLTDHPAQYRDIIRGLYSGLTSYRPAPWAGHATVMVACDHPPNRYRPKDLGWSEILGGELSSHIVPGDHLSMIRQPENARHVAQLMRDRIRAARQSLRAAASGHLGRAVSS